MELIGVAEPQLIQLETTFFFHRASEQMLGTLMNQPSSTRLSFNMSTQTSLHHLRHTYTSLTLLVVTASIHGLCQRSLWQKYFRPYIFPWVTHVSCKIFRPRKHPARQNDERSAVFGVSWGGWRRGKLVDELALLFIIELLNHQYVCSIRSFGLFVLPDC